MLLSEYIWRTRNNRMPPFLPSIELSSFLIKSKALPSETLPVWALGDVVSGRKRHSICAPTIESDAFIYFFLRAISLRLLFFQFPNLKNNQNSSISYGRVGLLLVYLLFIRFLYPFLHPQRKGAKSIMSNRREPKLLISSLALSNSWKQLSVYV